MGDRRFVQNDPPKAYPYLFNSGNPVQYAQARIKLVLTFHEQGVWPRVEADVQFLMVQPTRDLCVTNIINNLVLMQEQFRDASVLRANNARAAGTLTAAQETVSINSAINTFHEKEHQIRSIETIKIEQTS